MRRRTFLATTTSFGCTAFLSGCSEDSNNGSGSTNETQTQSDEDRAISHLNTAGEALQNAGEELSSESEKFSESSFSDGGIDFQPSTIKGYLDKASSELDAAEESATGAIQKQIDAARGYVSFARKLTEYLDVFAKGYSRTATGFTYFESERYSDAVTEFEEAESKFDKADDLLTLTQDRSQDLDTETLESIDKVEVDSMQTELTDLSELMPVMKSLAVGFRHMSEGMIDFGAGKENLDDEDYSKAQENLNNAADHFSAAETNYQDQENSAPNSVKSDVIQLTCYAGAMKDGCQHLAAAAEAQANGNYDRAESKSNEASEAFDRCSFDS